MLFQDCLNLLEKANLFIGDDAQTNSDLFFKNAQYSAFLLPTFKYLSLAKLLDNEGSENYRTLMANVKNSVFLGEIIERLYNAEPTLLIQENYKKLMECAEKSFNLAVILFQLSKNNLINQKNYSDLINNKEHLVFLAQIVEHLNNLNLLSEENFTLLMENAKHSNTLYAAIFTLAEANVRPNPETYTLLLASPQNAEQLATEKLGQEIVANIKNSTSDSLRFFNNGSPLQTIQEEEKVNKDEYKNPRIKGKA